MDKYTKTLMMFIKIPVGVLCILVGLAFIGVSVWVSTFSDIASMILMMAVLGGGALINFGVGYAFLDDSYKATNIVRGGNTRFAVVETTKFLKRRKIVTLAGAIAYVVLAIFYVVKMILSFTIGAQDDTTDPQPVALIVYAVMSLVIAAFMYVLYKKTKHEDLNEPEN